MPTSHLHLSSLSDSPVHLPTPLMQSSQLSDSVLYGLTSIPSRPRPSARVRHLDLRSGCLLAAPSEGDPNVLRSSSSADGKAVVRDLTCSSVFWKSAPRTNCLQHHSSTLTMSRLELSICGSVTQQKFYITDDLSSLTIMTLYVSRREISKREQSIFEDNQSTVWEHSTLTLKSARIIR
ncbi:hypothetical protein BGW80DRAFT_846775 [Lactifluus volemus]|nr:hypothetical protein BGW80DRAFT_846775 [Lactifluus volemus]